eukprot:4196265-Amphidinium_carterae.1
MVKIWSMAFCTIKPKQVTHFVATCEKSSGSCERSTVHHCRATHVSKTSRNRTQFQGLLQVFQARVPETTARLPKAANR